MSIENRAAAPALVEIGADAPSSTRRRPNRDERPSWLAEASSNRPSRASAAYLDALPRNEFLRDLQREKRRAERSHLALSLVLYRVAEAPLTHTRQMHRLLELLDSVKRETDILGHVGDDTLAVLCTDTDAAGTKGFMQKVSAHAGDLPFTGVAATYPDALFDSIATGSRVQPAIQPLLAHEPTDGRPPGYALKRSIDIVGAIVALTLFTPLMLVVAAAVKLTSPGPIIFTQTRIGKGGIPFTFYKFRSMTVDGDDHIHREFVTRLIQGEPTPPPATDAAPTATPYKLRADPRITRIGNLIRKTSIDELPQLFNVLKGEMSLVGPRPPIPYEAAHYQAWHLRRVMSLKPGLTGIWQVEGRSKVLFNEMVRMDLRYIRDCSLALDLKILSKTILVVLRCDGAG